MRRVVFRSVAMPVPDDKSIKDMLSKLEMGSWFKFQDEQLEHEFMLHFANKKSTKVLLFFAVASSLIMIPLNLVQLFSLVFPLEILYYAVTVLILLIVAASSWLLYYAQTKINESKPSPFEKYISMLQRVLMFSLCASISWFSFRVFFISTTEPTILQQLLPGWNCSKKCCCFTIDLIAYFVANPIIFIVSLCETRLEFIMLWIFISATSMIIVSWHYHPAYIFSILVWTAGLMFFSMELHIQKIWLFFVHHQLKEALLENERIADQTYADELRHMIGNVAHDLKTVSFFESASNCFYL